MMIEQSKSVSRDRYSGAEQRPRIDFQSVIKNGNCCAKIRPGKTVGTVMAPPSKSISHRMLICAALAEGESILQGLSFSQDIIATMEALSALGAVFEPCGTDEAGETVRVHGCGSRWTENGKVLCCRESGSTLRFLIPLCLLSAQPRELNGSTRLFQRPLTVYQQLFPDRWGEQQAGERGGFLQIKHGNVIRAGEYRLPGDVSSQFISGLLFALPLCCGEGSGESKIMLTSPLESRPYIDLTIDALRMYGIMAVWNGERELSIPAGQRYRPLDGKIEGDASNAAFFDALNAFGGDVQLKGLKKDSLQGDRVYRELFPLLRKRPKEKGTRPVIDLADCPDLAPILFTVAAEHGGAIFTHTDRLRIKECDRIAAMEQELSKFGAKLIAIDAKDTSTAAAVGGMVEVFPTVLHAPTQPLEGHNDHRVVMSLAILATKYGGEIHGASAVRKSLPDFFERLYALGADVELKV